MRHARITLFKRRPDGSGWMEYHQFLEQLSKKDHPRFDEGLFTQYFAAWELNRESIAHMIANSGIEVDSDYIPVISGDEFWTIFSFGSKEQFDAVVGEHLKTAESQNFLKIRNEMAEHLGVDITTHEYVVYDPSAIEYLTAEEVRKLVAV